MNPVDFIIKKRDGLALDTAEIASFVRGVTDGTIPDYQAAALLMAIYLNGMDAREVVDLTQAMAHSGDMLDLSGVHGVTADKHSTGGVGDTTTLVLVPLVACCGVKVAKMSGHGLGHTGGTLDKLTAIPGLTVSLSSQRFIEQVNRVGCAVIGQTGALAPADKALYALRDVTGTVESLPLVVSSILSKKLASGADVVVLDVKAGSGAIMKTLERSVELARVMVDIGNRLGKHFSALVTDMDQPLGLYIGNALEVEEAIGVLQGRVDGPLKEVSLQLGARMLVGARAARSVEDGVNMLVGAIESGAGLKKLAEMAEAQGGDPRAIFDPARLPKAPITRVFAAPESGILAGVDAAAIGSAARVLGAGRLTKDDIIDPAVGLIMHARVGDPVEKGAPLATLHIGAASDVAGAEALLAHAFRISKDAPEPKPLIHAVIEGGTK